MLQNSQGTFHAETGLPFVRTWPHAQFHTYEFHAIGLKVTRVVLVIRYMDI